MSRRYKYQRKHGYWGIGIIVAICLILVGACTYVKDIQTGTITFTVNRLDDQGGGSKHKYLVFTNRGVYQDTDNLFHGKFDSSDLFARLQVGKRYRCTYTGFRVPLFSSYRNLLGCTLIR